MEMSKLKPVFAGIMAGVIILLSIALFPELSWAPPLIKIGVVNWEQVVSRYKVFQEKIAEIQHRRERLLKFIEHENKSLSSGSGRKNSQDGEIYKEALNQIQSQKEQLIQKSHQKIYRIIKQVAVKRGYSLILSENQVLYASEVYADLTSPVIKKLNSDAKNEDSN